MGHSQADKAKSHDRIVRIAAARFRETGVEGIGVADLMKDAGLTHGGFYRHFGSRDELVAEAVECALREGAQAVAAAGAAKNAPLGAVVDAYLSTAHRDGLATSCAVATMAADVARSSAKARTVYTRQVCAYLDLLGKLIPAGKPRSRRKRAITALSTLVGAVALARAVNDDSLSQEILKAAAERLKVQDG